MATAPLQRSHPESMRDQQRQALEAFSRHYGGSRERSRFVIKVSPGDSDKRFDVTLLGTFNTRRERTLILSAPQTADGGLIAVNKGMNLQCGWMNASTAFKFSGVITKILFEPQPLVYLHLHEQVYFNAVRNVPRALVNLPAIIRAPALETALLVDVSVTGARLAVHRDVGLQAGQQLILSMRPPLSIELAGMLNIDCTVMGAADNADPSHPDIVFHGLKFTGLSERNTLVLHAFVQELLVNEMDTLAHVLMSARQLVDTHK